MVLIKLHNYYPDYKESVGSEYDITHFDVIARRDEKVGSVESVLVDEETGRIRYLVVDTGFWVFGKKVLLPIGLSQIVYMDRHVYVEGLTQEQVKALPEYSDDITIDSKYEERVKSVLRPLVAEAKTNQIDNPAIYDLDKEPYFYEIKNERLKAVQKQLVAKKRR
ncbi:MAG TPA: PRC-barrel domain-containing protein [Allocoleopsis sp.]